MTLRGLDLFVPARWGTLFKGSIDKKNSNLAWKNKNIFFLQF